MPNWKMVTVLPIVVYGVVFSWLFVKNLTVDTDYPYHLHSVWALNQGHYLTNPFINGGSTPTLAYGAPPALLGSLIFPAFGIYTVAVLMVLAFPLYWYSSRRLFRRLVKKRTVLKLAVLVALLNPMTIYLFMTAKLPFIWGTVFGLISLEFYLKHKTTPALLIGMLAVITHPLTIFLLAAILLVRFDLRSWLRQYFPVCAATAVLAFFLFGVPSLGGGAVNIPVLQTASLAGVLVAVSIFEKELRIPCAFSLLVLGVTIALGLIPTDYFDRIVWFILLALTPSLTKLALPLFRLKSAVIPASVLGVVLVISALCMRTTYAFFDNPAVYENLIADNQTVEILEKGYVRYSGDGSALYFLPTAGVRFSNSGIEVHEFSLPDNAESYLEQLMYENASFVLVYRLSPEENFLLGLDFPLVYDVDNLRIYRVPG
jgi:hypothetical protein